MTHTIKKIAVYALSGVVFLTGCSQQDPFGTGSVTPAPKTLVELVTGDRNFKLLAQAVTRANLGSALSGANLTVFAPNNAAFAAARIDSATIANTPVATLSAILRYHVLGTVVRSTDLPTGINREVMTLNGAAYVSKFDFGTPAVAVNGVRATLTDITASNGVMHIIDNVLIPPSGTIVDAVRGNPNFTFLLAAVTRANLGAALSGAGPITVFAPTDEAFRTTTPFRTIAQINAAAPADLAAILTYHATPGRIFTTSFVPEAYPVAGGIAVSSDAKKPGQFTTLAGGKVNVNGELKLTGIGNGTDAANITSGNIVATNGVIHVIDRVLLPK